jgi:hypothetical protein
MKIKGRHKLFKVVITFKTLSIAPLKGRLTNMNVSHLSRLLTLHSEHQVIISNITTSHRYLFLQETCDVFLQETWRLLVRTSPTHFSFALTQLLPARVDEEKTVGVYTHCLVNDSKTSFLF